MGFDLKGKKMKTRVAPKGSEGAVRVLPRLSKQFFKSSTYFLAILSLVSSFAFTSCSKDDDILKEDPGSEFKVHLFITPDPAAVKQGNHLKLTLRIDSKVYQLEADNNEIFYTTRIRIPAKVVCSIDAKTDVASTFHFKAYQDGRVVWGGGSGCTDFQYSRKDTLRL